MKIEIKYTGDYLLLIDEKAEIKEGDYNVPSDFWDISLTSIEDLEVVQDRKNGYLKAVAYYPLTKEAKELDLPLLPNPFKQIDIEKLACKKYNIKEGINDYDERYYNSHNVAKAEAFIEGYKAAQSKQFSFTQEELEELLLEAVRYPRYFGDDIPQDKVKKIIQSLSTQQLPKEFIPETYCNYGDDCPSKGAYDKQHLCDIKIKTITNSEGKEVLVGKWIY